MSSGDIHIPKWSVLDGYIGNRHTPTSYSVSNEDMISLLQRQALLPISQKSLSQFWCTSPPLREDIYQILNTDNLPTSVHVLLLDVLACNPKPKDLPVLWQTFVYSRFGVISEDPDLFTRSLQIIIQIEEKYPQSNKEIFTSILPSLFATGAQKRDSLNIPIHLLNQSLSNYYKKHGYLGIEAFLSEKGSLFQDIITYSARGDSNPPNLPQHMPGQYQNSPIPKFHQPTIQTYEHVWSPSLLFIGLFGLVLSLFSFRTQYKRLIALIFGFSILCTIEGSLEILSRPTYAQIRPLFSFINFSFDPYEEIYREDQKWWISQGGPTRWQEIPEHEDIFRIAVLGASSAHASNLLQNEGFAFLLEQQLQSEFGNTPIQVVNMAIGGTISNGILSSGNQAIEMGADSIIIYYGHNEVAQFQQLTRFQKMDTMTTQIYFSQSRIYAWLYSILPQTQSSPQNTTPINELPELPQIATWAAMNHHQNLGQLLEKCVQSNIPVLQIVPTYNFRFAPFEANKKESNVKAIQALEQAKELRPINLIAAQKKLLESIAISQKGSETFVQAQQIYAEILSDQGLHEKSRIAYQHIFDHSFGITTIHTEIKNNIQNLAAKYGTGLMYAEDIFYHDSSDGISANGLFWDELHPNSLGHQYLAKAIIPWAREQTSNFLDTSPSP